MKAIEIYELLDGVASDKAISPDFRDGYKVNQVIAATLESAEQQKWINVG